MNTLVYYEISIRYVGDRISLIFYAFRLISKLCPIYLTSVSLSLHCPRKYTIFCVLAELTLFITLF